LNETNELPKELVDELQKILAQKDEIEILIDELKVKEKEGGNFVVLQRECYTTTH
jgi:hypothetical protein